MSLVQQLDGALRNHHDKGSAAALRTAFEEVDAVVGAAADAAGAAAGTGVEAAESGAGAVIKTTLTFDDAPVALTDNAGTIAYGSQKIYDFPAGAIIILGVVVDLAITKSSTGVIATWDGDFSLGTAAANSGATLVGTEANVVPSTATPQAVAGATTADWDGVDTIASLTDATSATPADTIVNHADGTTYANDAAAIETNMSSLAAKINEILAAISGPKMLAVDGTATPVDLYFNVLVDDADHDVTSTPCNLILNGTISVLWAAIGDN